MIDTDKYEGQIEFDDVLREIEVGVDISEGNYDILRYYRDEYKDLLAEVKRLRVIEERYRRMGNVLTSRDEEIELWMDNFEVTSQDVGDLEQQYEDLLRQKTEEMIRESEGLDWKSIAYMTARLKVEMGYTCASSIEGYGDDE